MCESVCVVVSVFGLYHSAEWHAAYGSVCVCVCVCECVCECVCV